MNSGTRRIKIVTLFLIVFLYVISVSFGQEEEKKNSEEEGKAPNFERKVSGLIQKLMNSKYVRTPKLQRRLARIDETLNDNLKSEVKSDMVEKNNITKPYNQPTLLKIITNSSIYDATTSDVFG